MQDQKQRDLIANHSSPEKVESIIVPTPQVGATNKVEGFDRGDILQPSNLIPEVVVPAAEVAGEIGSYSEIPKPVAVADEQIEKVVETAVPEAVIAENNLAANVGEASVNPAPVAVSEARNNFLSGPEENVPVLDARELEEIFDPLKE